MNERTKTGLEILQVSVLLGVLGNVLLRQTPWGLNAFLFVAVFVATLLTFMWRRRPEFLTKANLALAGAMVFFASMFLIRDSEELLVWDTFAILVLMGVLLLANFDVKAHIAGTFHYAAGFVWSGLTSAFGPFVLLGSDIDWKTMPGNKLSKHLFAVLRGLAIALPLVLIFGALFMAADAAYEGLVNRTLNFDLDKVVSHVMITSVLAWLSAGYLRGALVIPFAPPVPKPENATSPIPKKDDPHAQAETRPLGSVSEASERTTETETASFVAKVAAEPGEEANSLPNNATILEHINISDPPEGNADLSPQPEPTEVGVPKRDWQNFDNSKLPSVFTLGTVETVIVLGLVDLLFVSFVAVQVPYLFGGMELVQNTPDLKLADYARRGFGELVAVSALVLPMLLLSHWLLRKDGSKVEGIFKILAGLQIGLLFVIMASAVQRLVLLTGELGYGLTTVRFYPMVLMTWLAVVFVWFAFTVFRGARNHFAWGALWSAIVILGATNLMNPDAFIVKSNLALMRQGRDFDAGYNASLSLDAVPALIAAIPELSPRDQCTTRMVLWGSSSSRNEQEVLDIRSWNLARSAARNLLVENTSIHGEQNFKTSCSDIFRGGFGDKATDHPLQ